MYHLQGADDICLHAQQLKLQYTANCYNKIKMVIVPPVATKEEMTANTVHFRFKLFQGWRIKRKWISKLWQLTSLSPYGGMKYIKINWRWPSSWRDVELKTKKCFYWLMNKSKKYVRSLQLIDHGVLKSPSKRSVRVIRSSRKKQYEFTWSKYEISHVHSKYRRGCISYNFETVYINFRTHWKSVRTRIDKNI